MEVCGLFLLAIVGLVPYLALILHGVERFSISSDLALEEYLVRHVWTGDTLVGMPSRFRWSHPGPLFFYAIAPFDALFEKACTGFYLGVCFLTAASAIFIVAALRLVAGRAHGIAALVVVLAWFVAFGNVAANPWTRLTNTLPLVTFIVCAAMFAAGSTRTLAPAVFFGALASETHVATVPLVFAVFAVVGTAFVGGRLWPERRPLTRDEWIALGAGIALAVLVSLPALIDERRHPEGGNIHQLIEFFRHRTEPYKTFDETLASWINVNGWLPDRLVSARIVDEGWLPYMTRWDLMPVHASRTASMILLVQAFATGAAVTVAYRRRDRHSLSLIAFGLLGAAAAFYGIRGIIGEVHPSLVFWASAPSTVVWIGVLSAFFSASAATFQRFARKPQARAGAIAGALVVGLLVAGMQRAWLSRFPVAPGSSGAGATVERSRRLYEALRDVERRDAFVPVMHLLPGEWGLVHFLVLEHDKDGVDMRIADDTIWTYPGGRSAAGAIHPRHVWVGAAGHDDVPFASCIDRIVELDDIVIYAADSATPVCTPP